MNTAPGPASKPCDICGTIPERCEAFIKGGVIETHLADSVARLEIWSQVPPGHHDYSVSSSGSHLKRCPQCGAFYLYQCSYDYFVNGSEDEIIITRLNGPLQLLPALMAHTPLKGREQVYRQQAAIAMEESDVQIRAMVAECRAKGRRKKQALEGLGFYAEFFSGKKICQDEIQDVIMDLYRPGAGIPTGSDYLRRGHQRAGSASGRRNPQTPAAPPE